MKIFAVIQHQGEILCVEIDNEKDTFLKKGRVVETFKAEGGSPPVDPAPFRAPAAEAKPVGPDSTALKRMKTRKFRIKSLQSFQDRKNIHIRPHLEGYALEFHDWMRARLNGELSRNVPLAKTYHRFWEEKYPTKKSYTEIVYGVAHAGWLGGLWDIDDGAGREVSLKVVV